MLILYVVYVAINKFSFLKKNNGWLFHFIEFPILFQITKVTSFLQIKDLSVFQCKEMTDDTD